jgi:hypothetical protein
MDDQIDRIPPTLTIEVVVSIHDPIVCGLDQAKEQRNDKDNPEAVQPVPDFRFNPRSQAKYVTHQIINAALSWLPFIRAARRPRFADNLNTITLMVLAARNQKGPH